MDRRAVLLRVLFISLAAAALFGAFGILFADDYDVIGQVAWTAVVTALAAVLMLAATRRVERGRVAPAVLTAVTLIIVLYVSIVAAIWDVFDLGEEFAWTALFAALVGVPVIAFVRMLAKPSTVYAARVGLVLAAIEMVLLLVLAWSDSPVWEDRFRVGQYAAALGPGALLTVACLLGAGRGDRRYWRWLGVAAAAIGFVLLAFRVHFDTYGNPPRLLWYCAALAGAVAHANICLLAPLRDSQLWLRRVTIGAGITTAALACLAVTWEGGGGSGSGSDLPGRAAGAAGLVAGCATLALFVVARVNQRLAPAPAASIPDVRDVTIVCPVCQRKQSLPVGGARCEGCNLQILVRVEEPRCAACGYSLLMLKATTCPECGAAVGQAVGMSS